MGTSLRLTADELRAVAVFLEDITSATRETGVTLGGGMRPVLDINGTTITFSWDAENERYALDDLVGD